MSLSDGQAWEKEFGYWDEQKKKNDEEFQNFLLETEKMFFKMMGVKKELINEVESNSFTFEQRKLIRKLMDSSYNQGRKD